MKKHLFLLSALLLQVAAVSVFAQGEVPMTIDMSEFEGLGITTVDEVLIGKIADRDVIFNEDGKLTDYVAPKYFDIDMYKQQRILRLKLFVRCCTNQRNNTFLYSS